MPSVVVTGAGSGIGKAVATTFGRDGWDVLCADLDYSAAESTAESIGPNAHPYELNVTDEQGCSEAINAASSMSELTAVVTCAGANARAPGHEMTMDTFNRVMSVNVNGTFHIAKAAGARMIENATPGSMVFISSINGVHALAGQAAYATSKAAVAMLAKVLAVDWGAAGIRVNAVGPGLTDTPMAAGMLADEEKMRWAMDRIPMKKVADPSDIADVVHFLCSDKARHVTGAFVPVDGGWLTGA